MGKILQNDEIYVPSNIVPITLAEFQLGMESFEAELEILGLIPVTEADGLGLESNDVGFFERLLDMLKRFIKFIGGFFRSLTNRGQKVVKNLKQVRKDLTLGGMMSDEELLKFKGKLHTFTLLNSYTFSHNNNKVIEFKNVIMSRAMLKSITHMRDIAKNSKIHSLRALDLSIYGPDIDNTTRFGITRVSSYNGLVIDKSALLSDYIVNSFTDNK